MKRPDGSLRLACFGDSFTFGDEVQDAWCYPAMLEQRNPGLEALNYGVGAYGTDQALLQIHLQGEVCLDVGASTGGPVRKTCFVRGGTYGKLGVAGIAFRRQLRERTIPTRFYDVPCETGRASAKHRLPGNIDSVLY